MLKLQLIDREVEEAMKGVEELYDLVKHTESILNEILNRSDICINDISDDDMRITNDLINISKSVLILAANERKAINIILENQKTIIDKIKDTDDRIYNLIYREVWINSNSQRRQNDESGWQIFILSSFLLNI